MAIRPSEKPEFSKKWWLGVKPANIKGSDLEKALQNVEKALAEQKKKSDDADAIEECLTALEAVSSAVDKTTKKELDKKKDKDLITVLEKFDPLIDSEKSRLEDLQESAGKASDGDEDEDEEGGEGKLFEPDYLYKMIKLMKSGGQELRFGFGLNTSTPEASRLLLKRKGKPEMLYKALKRTGEYSNRLMTYGMALADPDDGQTLVFRLDAGADEPPQFMKLGRRYLRADKNLRFRKLKVFLSTGKTLEDEPEEDEEGTAPADSAGTGELQQLVSGATTAAGIWTRTGESVADQIDRLRQELDGFDDADVKAVRDRLTSVTDRFPKLELASLVGAADAAAFKRGLEQTRAGVEKWRSLLTSDPVLKALDKNPFAETTVSETYGDALDRIATALRI